MADASDINPDSLTATAGGDFQASDDSDHDHEMITYSPPMSPPIQTGYRARDAEHLSSVTSQLPINPSGPVRSVAGNLRIGPPLASSSAVEDRVSPLVDNRNKS